MLSLTDYDITPHHGFLSPWDMSAVTLPPSFTPIEHAGQRLSDYLTAGAVRPTLDRLPELAMTAELTALTDPQLRKAMVHYSFLVQAYIWGDDKPSDRLPRNLAVPYCDLAEKMGQFPLLPYSAYTLDNWGNIDPSKGVTLDNIYCMQNFLDGQDENWFILVHVEIEAKAGRALAAIPALLVAARERTIADIATGLTEVRESLQLCYDVFGRMTEKCDPYIYYNRVRPYIHGWKGNPALPAGVLYEGVEKFGGKPQSFRGQTGSQSSIIPTMDALLGIDHENDPLREYLDELHQYRPPRHRLFIEAVSRESTLRSVIAEAHNPAVTTLYNECITLVDKFRTRHLEYAANYINKQASHGEGNPVDVGTGGTPFMKYLKKHRDESRSHLLPMPG